MTTSDYGTTALFSPDQPGPRVGQVGAGGCADHGKDGAYLTSGAPVTGSFLVESFGLINYTGSRHDAIAQMVRVGSSGCGFEQPLASAVRALSNGQGNGFRRIDANLLVLVVTDEDDCSIRDPAMFSGAESVLGPLDSFRCTRFGITCDEPIDTLGEKHGCHARIDSPYIEDVSLLVDQIAKSAIDPSQLAVGVIAGTPEPVVVEQRSSPGGGSPIAALQHSCSSNGGGTIAADPGVRLLDATQQLGSHGAFESICSANLRPALTGLARMASQMFGVACLDSTKLLDVSLEPGIQPACTAVEIRDGNVNDLPQCPADGDCFDIISDFVACAMPGERLRFVVNYVVPPTARTYIRARCEVR
ncbi:hypothetical protein BH11MYX3_BH11MYX3_19100 [soil metagenome]